jgi:dUTP pyrophosphatase
VPASKLDYEPYRKMLDADGFITYVSSPPVVKFKRLDPAAQLPVRATEGAACWDLFSLEDRWMSPSVARLVLRTGIGIELPPGYVGLVCSRSGLAARQGLFVLNAPGIIDADYRGELLVIMGMQVDDYLWPKIDDPIKIAAGSRIAQLMVMPLPQLQVAEVTEFSTTERGEGGLGSTGV